MGFRKGPSRADMRRAEAAAVVQTELEAEQAAAYERIADESTRQQDEFQRSTAGRSESSAEATFRKVGEQVRAEREARSPEDWMRIDPVGYLFRTATGASSRSSHTSQAPPVEDTIVPRDTPSPDRDPRIVAREIFGFIPDTSLSRQAVVKRYGALLRDAHTDHGGMREMAAERIQQLQWAKAIFEVEFPKPTGRTTSVHPGSMGVTGNNM